LTKGNPGEVRSFTVLTQPAPTRIAPNKIAKIFFIDANAITFLLRVKPERTQYGA
jgi:hypothetical protein